MNTVKMDELTTEILQILNETNSAVDTALTETMEISAKNTVNELKSTSPSRKGMPKRYAKGWTYTRKKGEYIVYNKTHYRLTHLLEHSHRTRFKTGRYGAKTTTAANPHIAKAEENMKKEIGNILEKQFDIQMRKI